MRTQTEAMKGRNDRPILRSLHVNNTTAALINMWLDTMYFVTRMSVA
jgi:hypothetical protein